MLEKDANGAEEIAVVWLHPRSWKTDNHTRRYITLPERGWSREGDFETLCRSVRHLLKQQDEAALPYIGFDYRAKQTHS